MSTGSTGQMSECRVTDSQGYENEREEERKTSVEPEKTEETRVPYLISVLDAYNSRDAKLQVKPQER